MTPIRIAAGCLCAVLATSARAELKTYDVDFQYQREVYEALRGVLVEDPVRGQQGATFGRIQLLPTGQIVVDAAPATHMQIEALLASIRERSAGRTPRAALRYWVVLGNRAALRDGERPAADEVPALRSVLAELDRWHGDLTFTVMSSANLVTESGQEGSAESQPFSVQQRVYVEGDTASAQIELDYLQMSERPAGPPLVYEGELTVNVTLERGEFLVLGENTARSPVLQGTLFYIVHWPGSE